MCTVTTTGYGIRTGGEDRLVRLVRALGVISGLENMGREQHRLVNAIMAEVLPPDDEKEE